MAGLLTQAHYDALPVGATRVAMMAAMGGQAPTSRTESAGGQTLVWADAFGNSIAVTLRDDVIVDRAATFSASESPDVAFGCFGLVVLIVAIVFIVGRFST